MSEQHLYGFQLKYKDMFFSIKLCALFFFLIPIYQKIQIEVEFYTVNLISMFLSLAIILILLFLLIMIDAKKRKSTMYMALEVFTFFVLCIVSVYLSGGYESYFKSLFIFIIVTYTIEFGMIPGLIIAGASSVALFVIDLVSLPSISVTSILKVISRCLLCLG